VLVLVLESAEAKMESNNARPLLELELPEGGSVGAGESWSSAPLRTANKDSTVIVDVEFGIWVVEGEAAERTGVGPNFAKSMSSSETPPLV